jgi:hypothetical protein
VHVVSHRRIKVKWLELRSGNYYLTQISSASAEMKEALINEYKSYFDAMQQPKKKSDE